MLHSRCALHAIASIQNGLLHCADFTATIQQMEGKDVFLQQEDNVGEWQSACLLEVRFQNTVQAVHQMEFKRQFLHTRFVVSVDHAHRHRP